MPTSGPNYLGSITTLAGGNGSWANATVARLNSDDALYAVWSKPAATNQVSPGLECNTFGTFAGVASDATINSVILEANAFVANTARMQGFRYELWNGATSQIGITQFGANITSIANVDSILFTGVTFAQLAGLRVRVYGRGAAANAQTSSGSVDFVRLTVDYTPAVRASFLLFAGSRGRRY